MQIQDYQERFRNYESLNIQGKRMWIPHPEEIPSIDYVEREDLIEQALAAWMKIDGLSPAHIRFYGPSGSGKNALVCKLTRMLKKDLYIINGDEDLRAEDISCSITTAPNNTFEYVGSPLLAAMLSGGICFFDEIDKAPHSALAPLASVLDDRRTINSRLACVQLKAHEDFLFCTALNDIDRMPVYISKRLNPSILVDFPSVSMLKKILKTHLSKVDEQWIEIFLTEFVKEKISPKDVINILSFAYKLAKRNSKTKVNKKEIRDCLKQAMSNGSHQQENYEKLLKKDTIDEREFTYSFIN
jgi:MoxR-like ATPase